jgi:hypothetical protein
MFDLEFSGCLDDESLGPNVHGCRDDFDFTLQFEKIFLSILPASIFTASSLARIILLSQRPAIVRGVFFQSLKVVSLVDSSAGPKDVMH